MHYNVRNTLYDHGFDGNSKTGVIYMDLYNALVKAIVNRKFVANSRLPPSRVLAKDLGISRSTVIKAYDLLVLEKYLYTIPGSGNFVAPSRNKKIYTHLNASSKSGKYPTISKRGKSLKKSLNKVSRPKDGGIAFRPGLPPLDIFPVKQWKKLADEYWREIKSSELSYSNTIGLECLRENISNYLKIYRNINCDAEQIVITTGSLHSLYLLATILIDGGDQVILENPTYPYAYSLFSGLKARISIAKIDEEGVSVETLKRANPKLIYTTPSNQYPLGVKMSIARRLELLKWANEKNTFIVEDDYDHEFSNWEKPLSSIYSLDQQDRVIYLGTFNKLLHPSIRIGYMIVPHYLLDALKALYEQSSRFVSTSLQKTLSSFIERDYLNKHLRNVILTSQNRKEVFIDFFENRLSGKFTLQSKTLGLHIIAKSKLSISDDTIAEHLAKNNIVTYPFSNYYIGKTSNSGLIMGYASVNEKVMKRKIEVMGNLMDELA